MFNPQHQQDQGLNATIYAGPQMVGQFHLTPVQLWQLPAPQAAIYGSQSIPSPYLDHHCAISQQQPPPGPPAAINVVYVAPLVAQPSIFGSHLILIQPAVLNAAIYGPQQPDHVPEAMDID